MRLTSMSEKIYQNKSLDAYAILVIGIGLLQTLSFFKYAGPTFREFDQALLLGNIFATFLPFSGVFLILFERIKKFHVFPAPVKIFLLLRQLR